MTISNQGAQPAIGSCGFLRAYSFRGHATRAEFWMVVVATKLLALGLFVSTTPFSLGRGATALRMSPGDEWVTAILMLLVWLMPVAAVVVRRLHDLGQSGWWAVLLLIGLPLATASIWLAVLFTAVVYGLLGLKAGTPDARPAAAGRSFSEAILLLLIAPVSVAGLGFLLLRSGPVEATYQRLAGPAVESQVVLEMDTKVLVEEWLERVARSLRRTLIVKRVPAFVTTGGGFIRVMPSAGGRVDIEIVTRALGEMLAPDQVYAFEIKSAADAITIAPSSGGMATRIDQGIRDAIWKMRLRLSDLGVWGPAIQRVGKKRLLVVTPGFGDVGRLKAVLTRQGNLAFHAIERELTLEESKGYRVASDVALLRARTGETVFAIKRLAAVSGEDLDKVELGRDGRTNEPVVLFRLNYDGARRFGKLTQENVGKRFAVVVDSEVLSAPIVREPILMGWGQIVVEKPDDTALLVINLRSGALPAPFTIFEERVIGDRGK